MGRPVFSYELGDPDFSWLISSFQENHPQYSCVETSSLPVVFIRHRSYEEMTEIDELLGDNEPQSDNAEEG